MNKIKYISYLLLCQSIYCSTLIIPQRSIILASGTGFQSTTLGDNSSANGYQATAIGYNSKANGSYAVSLGVNASALYNGSISIGTDSKTTNNYSLALGTSAQTSGPNSIAIGYNSKSSENSLAFGIKAITNNSVVLGARSTDRNLISSNTISKFNNEQNHDLNTKIATNKQNIDSNSSNIKKHHTQINNNTIEIENLKKNNQKLADNINNNSNNIQKLNTKLEKGLAITTAISGIEFIPIEKGEVAIGAAVSTYHEKQAIAIGIQGAPSENFRINSKIGVVPTKNTEFAGSIGASWKFKCY